MKQNLLFFSPHHCACLNVCYVHTSIYTHQFTHINLRTSIQAHQFMQINLRASIYANQFTHINLRTSIYAHQFTRINLHTSIYTRQSNYRHTAQSPQLFFLLCYILLNSRDSSVGIVTRLQADTPRSWCSTLGSVSKCLPHTDSGACPYSQGRVTGE